MDKRARVANCNAIIYTDRSGGHYTAIFADQYTGAVVASVEFNAHGNAIYIRDAHGATAGVYIFTDDNRRRARQNRRSARRKRDPDPNAYSDPAGHDHGHLDTGTNGGKC